MVGSGPAGLACAQQLARAGHGVTVFEKHDRIGGLLRYGIPDFKMEKHLIDRRMRQMEAEGVAFRTGVEVGAGMSVAMLLQDYDALVMSGGAEAPRDLEVENRELDGIHFAMDFLTQQNKRVAGDPEERAAPERHDQRQGQACRRDRRRRHRFGLHRHLQPPWRARRSPNSKSCPSRRLQENKALIWPDWPLKLRTSSSHEEGGERDWSVLTKRAIGEDGKISGARMRARRMGQGRDGRQQMREIPGSDFELKADLVLLAMGFVGPRKNGLVEQSGVALDPRGNVKANVADYKTSVQKIFSCGDMRRGQSLVVWAIREGRQCARAVDEFLMGVSELPR